MKPLTSWRSRCANDDQSAQKTVKAMTAATCMRVCCASFRWLIDPERLSEPGASSSSAARKSMIVSCKPCSVSEPSSMTSCARKRRSSCTCLARGPSARYWTTRYTRCRSGVTWRHAAQDGTLHRWTSSGIGPGPQGQDASYRVSGDHGGQRSTYISLSMPLYLKV